MGASVGNVDGEDESDGDSDGEVVSVGASVGDIDTDGANETVGQSDTDGDSDDNIDTDGEVVLVGESDTDREVYCKQRTIEFRKPSKYRRNLSLRNVLARLLQLCRGLGPGLLYSR